MQGIKKDLKLTCAFKSHTGAHALPAQDKTSKDAPASVPGVVLPQETMKPEVVGSQDRVSAWFLHGLCVVYIVILYPKKTMASL